MYHRPKGESVENLALMRRIDKLFLECPFYGSRQMVRHVWREGVCVGRHRVRRLMRLMGLEAIYQAPRTTRPHPEHRVYPYLLKGLAIERPNHAWCADITYIPVQKGFLYLVAVMDWATRRVLSWRLSNTLDARFCTDALTEALQRYDRPEIFNTDQGSQFTSCPSAGSTGTAGRVKQDPGGMIDHLEYTLTPPPSCPRNQDHLRQRPPIVHRAIARPTRVEGLGRPPRKRPQSTVSYDSPFLYFG